MENDETGFGKACEKLGYEFRVARRLLAHAKLAASLAIGGEQCAKDGQHARCALLCCQLAAAFRVYLQVSEATGLDEIPPERLENGRRAVRKPPCFCATFRECVSGVTTRRECTENRLRSRIVPDWPAPRMEDRRRRKDLRHGETSGQK